MRVHELDRIGDRRHPHHDEHGSEDLLAIHLHRGSHAVEQAATEEEPVFVAGYFQPAAIHDQARALGLSRGDVVHDLGAMRRRDQRTHVGRAILRMVHAQSAHALGKRIHEPVARLVAHRDRDGDRHAALARRPVGRA